MENLREALFLEAAFAEHAARKPNVGDASPILDREEWYRVIGGGLLNLHRRYYRSRA